MGLDVDEEHKRAYHLPVFLGPFDSEIPTTESTPRSDSRGGRLSYNSEINWWIAGRRWASDESDLGCPFFSLPLGATVNSPQGSNATLSLAPKSRMS